jgi:hypothetical protein
MKYDEEGAARFLGGEAAPLSPRTLQRWRQTGDGPRFLKLGNAVRYEESDLEDFLRNNRRASTSEAASNSVAA